MAAVVAATSTDSLPSSAEPTDAIQTAPSTSPSKPNSLLTWVRGRVSQNKRRWVDERFNLDLTYITPNIIAMGYPAQGTAHYYRNPMDEVERFLDERHGEHYCVYNLCSEMHYDLSSCFHGRFKRFPFDDHCVPTLELVHDFIADALRWLSASPLQPLTEETAPPLLPVGASDNVVVVHCKAGKGRTGLMVSCLLLAAYPNVFPDAGAAIQYFDHMRTVDSSGMTVPSQRRYVHYFDYMRRFMGGLPPPSQDSRVRLRSVEVMSSSFHKVTNIDDVYFVVLGSCDTTTTSKLVSQSAGCSLDDISTTEHSKKRKESGRNAVVLLDSRPYLPQGPLVARSKCLFDLPQDVAVLCGNIRVVFYKRKPYVLRGCESAAFSIALNTYFCCFEKECTLFFSEHDVDGFVTEKVGKRLGVRLSFEKVEEPHTS